MTTRSTPAVADIAIWLRQRAAELLGVPAEVIRDDEIITRYGMDSLKTMRWIADLGHWLGRALSPVVTFEHPTIAGLAQHLAGAEPARSPRIALAGAALAHEPVAIIGMACRVPGADTPQAFWQALCQGRHEVRQVDDRRWPVSRFHAEGRDSPGRSHTRWAGLLRDDQIAAFDPLFFRISPREAEEIDPQQRMFLELCWDALQDAGMRPFALTDTRTGVFAGVVWDDYGQLNARNPAGLSLHSATGKSRAMVANRVSYVFGLQGPSISLDTACSSSLCAVHLACQSLATGDSDLALAGGINLLVDPLTMVSLSKFGGLSAGSACRAFDASADGFVRGEGGGVVVLKRMSRAIGDGDRVYAVIGGTAMNNDGASNGLTAPNPRAQEGVLRQAWARCGVEPARVDYVESHGTGTALGDPIEAKALGTVFGGQDRDPGRPLRIGSVKTNIGHLEGAAGIAGLIKTTLALHERTLPPSLHFEVPNPYIAFDDLRIQVQRELERWPSRDGEPLYAGVSAFGWGGTNCHVALQSVTRPTPPRQWRAAERDDAALRDAVARWQLQPGEIGDGPSRIAMTCRDAATAQALVDAMLAGRMGPGIARGQAVARPRLAFVCAPQGGQWRGMARSLLREQPVFRRAIVAVHQAYAAHASWSLLDALADDRADWAWQRVHTIQPMIAAVQVGLAALWRSWGITPDDYVGHSLGELAAAHLSGALELDDFARLVIHYSRLQTTTCASGTMAIVGIGADEARARLALPDGVVIAGENSPDSVVLSGVRALLEPLLGALQAEGTFARFIDVNVAAHSPHFDPILDELRAALAPLRPQPAHTPMISTLWAREVSGRELGASYWPANLREPVRFAQAIELLVQRGTTAFVELSPHPILVPAIRQTLARCGHTATVVESTRRGEDETRAMLESLGQLFVTGHDASSRPRYAAAAGRRMAVIDDPADAVAPATVPIVLSARSEGGLGGARTELLRRCETAPGMSARRLAGRLARLDGKFPHRRVARLAAGQPLRSALAAEAQGTIAGEVDAGRRRKVVFVCPGQGAQWRGMARDLIASEPVFADAIARIDALAAGYMTRSLRDELLGAHDRPWTIDVIQPLLFAIEVALGELWRSWGVVPDAVVGHSMGEAAAIYLAGAITLEDAVRVICVRSKLMTRASGRGGMLAVELSRDDALGVTAPHARQVAVAVSNSPSSTVLSGDPDALEVIRAELDARGVFCRWVKVDVASHSPQMDPLLEELSQLLAGVSSVAGRTPIYSTVTGARIDGAGLGPAYWIDNLRQTVLFGDTIAQLIADGHDAFIELSPHPILLASIEQCFDHAEADAPGALASMRRDEPGVPVMLESAARLYALGHDVDWTAVAPHDVGADVTLQPWDREQVWLPGGMGAFAQAAALAGPHPLLGERFDNALEPALRGWNVGLTLAAAPWLRDHRVRDSILASFAVSAELMLAALAELAPGPVELRDIELSHPLIVGAPGARQIHLSLRDDADGSTGMLGVFSRGRDEIDWTAHAQGRFARTPAAPPPASSLGALRARLTQAMAVDELYQAMARRGLQLGPAFRPITSLWRAGAEALALLDLPLGADAAASFVSHPVMLDGALQVVLAALGEQDGMYLSVGVGRLSLRRSPLPTRLWSHAQLVSRGADAEANIAIYDDRGELVAIVEALRLRRLAEPDAVAAEREVGSDALLDRLRREPAGPARRARFEAGVRGELGQVLGIAPDRIDGKRTLQAMGLTSLMAIELRNRLSALIGHRLAASLAWNYPTLNALLGYLASLLPVPLDADAGVAPAERARGLARGTIAPVPGIEVTVPDHATPARAEVSLDDGGVDAQLREELARLEALLNEGTKVVG